MHLSRECTICSAEADWVRVRKRIAGQMTYLCDRHYQSLLGRNPEMASWYEHIAAVAPLEMPDGASALQERVS